MNMSPSQLRKGLPLQLEHLLDHVKGLAFEEGRIMDTNDDLGGAENKEKTR